MDEIRVGATRLTHIPGYHAALDEVAKERRYLAFLQAPSLEQSTQFVQWLDGGGGLHFVATTTEDVVVGWCDVVRQPHEGFRHVGQLGMGVVGPFRRRGVGRQLVKAARDGGREIGLRRFELEVFRSNAAAVRLYESFGFQHEGLKRAARILDGITDDVAIMALVVALAI
jgi:RimJ/RimL family protein N-acetyltransferase